MPCRSILRASSLLLLLIGCTGDPSDKQQGDDTGGGTGTDDSGQDTSPQYEPGCILVDGAGGYAWLNDAIAVASEGSEITLCAGALEEEVTVSKGVTITGPGSAAFTLTAPTNTTALTITAANVSVSGLTIASTRSGIAIEGASGVTLSDISMSAVDNYGVNAEDADDLLITGSTFIGVGYGAIQASGGTLTVQDSTFTDNASFGVKVTDGGELVATGNTITGTTPIDPEAREVSDGFGVWLEESDGALSDNVLADNFLIGVYADTGDLSLSGDQISGSLYGALCAVGVFSVDGATITDNTYVGLYGVTYDSVTVTNTTISGDPELTISVAASDWLRTRSDEYLLGTGLVARAPSIAVSDLSVTGYNNAGLYVGPVESGEECEVSLARLNLTDNGRVGMYAAEADLTAEDVNVSGLIETEEAAEGEQCYSVGGNAAVTLSYSAASWTGGSILDNDGYGIASVYSVLIFDGGTISGNSCAGIMNFGGTMQATNGDFSNSIGNSFQGSVVSYEGSEAIITGNLFHDSQEYREYSTYEYDDGAGNIYEYHYYQYDGSDIQVWYGGDNLIADNVFLDGGDGVQVIYADAEIEDNTWSNYKGNVLYAYGEGTETVSIKDNTVDGFNGYGVYCGYITLEIENLSLVNGGSYMYGMDAYLNDAPYYSYTSEYAQPVINGYNCSWASTDVEIADTEGHLAFIYGGTWEFEGLQADTVGQAATYYDTLQLYTYYDTDVTLRDSSITDVGYGAAIGQVMATSAVSSTLRLENVAIDGTADNGVSVETYSSSYSMPVFEAVGLSVQNVTYDGIYLYYATATIDDSTIIGAPSDGLAASESTTVASGLDISGSGSYGGYVSGGAFTMSESSITGSAYDGLYLYDTTASVTGNTITGNGAYGMSCSTVSFDACGNDLSGNTSGEQSGCDESCATP